MTVIDTPPTTLPAHPTPTTPGAEKVFAVLGEFDNVTDVMHATQAAHDAGYRQMDVHSPFPIHGIDEALGVKQTILPWLVLGMGLTGMTTGILLTTFTMTDFMPQPDFVPANFHGYKFLISGKPFQQLRRVRPGDLRAHHHVQRLHRGLRDVPAQQAAAALPPVFQKRTLPPRHPGPFFPGHRVA